MKNSLKKILVSLFTILLLLTIIPSNITKAEDEEVIEQNETQETTEQEIIEEVEEAFEDEKEIAEEMNEELIEEDFEIQEELEIITYENIIENELLLSPSNPQPTDGIAYAVLDYGDLVFFRSFETYKNKSSGTFRDIYNNSYDGIVFSGIESYNPNNDSYHASTSLWGDYYNSIYNVYVANNQIITPISMKDWFYYCENMESFNSIGFDTSNVTDMNSMFSWCSTLTSLDLSNFNTSKVKDMGLMFYECSSLESLDLSSFNTTKVTYMGSMFNNCTSLKSLNISGFNTSNVTGMRDMFYNCSSLTSLDLSNFNTSKVKDMIGMFSECSSLKSLDLSSFNTSKVTDMSYMFNGCSSLTSLDLSNFNTFKETDMASMFSRCPSLKKIILGNEFTSWKDNTAFTAGYWNNKAKGIIKTETELCNEYPLNASSWYGEWTRDPVEDFVRRLYKLCLNRNADNNGLNYYVSRLNSGEFTAAQVVKNFYNSPEMKNLNLSDQQFVERCYRAMMDRSSDNEGRKFWKDILTKGVSRMFVVRGFVESPEFVGICNSYEVIKGSVDVDENRDINIGATEFIARCYTKALGRDYDINGLNYHTGIINTAINKKTTAVNIATSGFFHSPEFLNKNTSNLDFVKICYRTFLGREAEGEGLQFYLNRLNNGESRDVLLSNFADSPEFTNIMASYGIR